MRLEKVLVAVDFSPSALKAAKWVVRHVAGGAEAVLFHAVEAVTPPSFLGDLLPERAAAMDAARRDAEARMKDFAASLESGRVQTVIATGRPADEIARAAEGLEVDLVVVGPHGAGATEWDALGSTAEQLVRGSRIPVLVARGVEDGTPGRILVGVDESDMTRPVLAYARFLADRFDADIVALHVLDPGLYGAIRKAPTAEEVDRIEDEARQTTARWLRAQAEAAGLEPERVEPRVALGDPKFEIVAAAEECGAGLIVMGSRGAGTVGPARLGGVAGSVLRGYRHPVLVVLDPDRA